MSKLCERCGGTGLEPENDIPFVSPGKGHAANIYQDLLAGAWGRPFTAGDLSDTEGYDDDK